MQADRELMKLRLKEIYSFNSYDLDKIETEQHIAAPYNYEQHQAFLHKFTYYLQDSLRAFDGRIADKKIAFTQAVNVHSEDSMDQREAWQLVVGDRNEAHQKADERSAAAFHEAFAELQDDELAALQDNRDAAESLALSLTEEARLGVIYAMHVLQYAGGADRGNFGFGLSGSSYYNKGNALIGIDELDLYRRPNAHGYAQVSENLNTDDVHHANLEQALEDAKTGFDDAIKACVDDFTAHAEAEAQQSADTMADYMATLADITSYSYDDMVALGAEAEADLLAANNDRRDAFATYAQGHLDAFNADVDAQAAKVEA
jgi:hypothetical protein